MWSKKSVKAGRALTILSDVDQEEHKYLREQFTGCKIRTLPNLGHGTAKGRAHFMFLQSEDSNSV